MVIIVYVVRRFHPNCMNITTEHVKKLDHFLCPDCDQANDRKGKNSNKASPPPEPPKVSLLLLHMLSAVLSNMVCQFTVYHFWCWLTGGDMKIISCKYASFGI